MPKELVLMVTVLPTMTVVVFLGYFGLNLRGTPSRVSALSGTKPSRRAGCVGLVLRSVVLALPKGGRANTNVHYQDCVERSDWVVF